jgi:hypothetical protein
MNCSKNQIFRQTDAAIKHNADRHVKVLKVFHKHVTPTSTYPQAVRAGVL